MSTLFLDANNQPVPDPASVAFVEFMGIAGHFSTYAVLLVGTARDTRPPKSRWR